ncbi:alpha/beta fold hydrolase [Halobacillus aidingensis]|uniref:Pimeloyl-ACP methyl ester carboxylesterase n=1 Tax=Halobacillus aidingensis TaxID=240303 RepID=A0A1H0K6S0_HALAD|nr:alpha/beta hydrolase [Halobacillus aidingensis]SDO51411.1 Pimeloyl-ACP methyl ester carboxylesterase [Halobacillus aidingensis]
MERYFIKIRDKKVRVTEWGEKSHPVIFCLHGLGSTSLSFIEIAEALQHEYRIISIDAPGHGRTESFDSEEDYEMKAMVRWLKEVHQKLELEELYFLSHSWGSFVALFYVDAFPNPVVGSILLDGGYQTKRLGNQTVEEEVAFYEKDFEESVESWDTFLDVAVFAPGARRSDSLKLAGEDLALKKDGKFYWHARGLTAAAIVRAMHKDETADLYHRLPSDLLLLRATQPVHMEVQRKKTSSIFEKETGAEVVEVAGTSHMMHWDRPQRIVQYIRNQWS